jgi:ketosteroid isomerase-like protein
VRAGLEAFVRGDWDRLTALYDPDVVVRNDPSWPERVISGREAVIEWFRSAWELLGTETRIEGVQDLGERVLVRVCWSVHGAHSGIEGDMRWSLVATLRDGHIALLEQFLDHEQAEKAASVEG